MDNIPDTSELDGLFDHKSFKKRENIFKSTLSLAENIENLGVNSAHTFNLEAKVAYILWKYPKTRNDYVYLALVLYKKLYPEVSKKNTLQFSDFLELPKMYDIQRSSQRLQNTLGWCPPDLEVLEARRKKQKVKQDQYSPSTEGQSAESNMCLFLDETGKNEDLFIVGGVSFASIRQAEHYEETLRDKIDNPTKEFKYNKINPSNLSEYKNFFKLSMDLKYLKFFSVILKNKGISKENKRLKTKKCTEILITSIVYKSIQDGRSTKLHLALDKDGEMDEFEKNEYRNDVEKLILRDSYGNCSLGNLLWEDSDKLYTIQLADLYIGALNNILIDKSTDSNKGEAKREFSIFVMESLGVDCKNITKPTYWNTIRVIN